MTSPIVVGTTHELLKSPIHLKAGEKRIDVEYTLAPDFKSDTTLSAIYVGRDSQQDASSVQIRKVKITTGITHWPTRWNTYSDPYEVPGIPSGTCGIRVQRAPGIKIEDCEISGFPRTAIDAHGIPGGLLHRLQITRCFQGVTIRDIAPNSRVQIDGVFGGDLWGPETGHWPGIGGYPSRVRPGEFIGSDLLAVGGIEGGLIRNVHARGEYLRAIKAGRCTNTVFEGCSGSSVQFQGTYAAGQEPMRGCVMRDCAWDKRLGYGATTEGISHQLQVSYDVENLLVERCSFSANGKLGNAIQHAGRCSATYRDCTFYGFDTAPPGWLPYALDLSDNTCSVGGDFEGDNMFPGTPNHVRRVA